MAKLAREPNDCAPRKTVAFGLPLNDYDTGQRFDQQPGKRGTESAESPTLTRWVVQNPTILILPMIPPVDSVLVDARETLDRLRGELLADRGDASHWTGTLSPSALSTATAVSALAIVERERKDGSLRSLIAGGVRYLRGAQNSDGGFGDTDRSYSNIATTMLGIAALRLAADDDPETARAIERGEAYVERHGGIAALRRRYGKDKTFVIPILTNAALAGMVPWSEVQALPFEAAAVPQSWYRRVRMPVVSYAIPALVAIGQAHFFHAPPRNPLVAAIRKRVVGRTLEVLQRMQPASGGYLEATPLTSFVLMSLASTGRADHTVSKEAVRFLQESVLADGSWPIDTNLATWVTSLSIHALACGPEKDRRWATADLLDWLLSCQHVERHPFTGAEPGGWGWTDLSGAVPDGDDTPAALLALAHFLESPELTERDRQRIETAAKAGAEWLLRLQNRDGGWPTFCRGWGRLPFDRSSTDLTAHAIRALGSAAVHRSASQADRDRHRRAIQRGWKFLAKSQEEDGSWSPLWFGNQDNPDDRNPAYGTGRVLMAAGGDSAAASRAADFLVGTQNRDGGWGGGRSLTHWLREGTAAVESEGKVASEAGISSIEETAIALEGLAAFALAATDQRPLDQPPHASVRFLRAGGEPDASAWRLMGERLMGERAVGERPVAGEAIGGGASAHRSAIIRAVRFLCEAVREDRHHNPWPIGFYFAKLWYHERLYPTIFATAALGTALRVLERSSAEIQRDAERV